MMCRFVLLGWSFVALLLVAPEATVLAAAPDLRFAKPVELPELDGEELVAVPLDSDVYAATDDQFPDVRLLDASGDEAAYIIRPATTKRTRTASRTFRVDKPAVRPLDDGGLEISFEIDVTKHPQPLEGVRLVTPLENFERRVAVSVSADGETWTTLVEDGLVFDYTQFMDVQNVDLALPAAEQQAIGGDVRRYRIVIDDVTQEQQSQLMELTRKLQGDDETNRTERIVVNRQPFRINRIEYRHDVEVADAPVAVTTSYPLTGFRVEQDAESKTTFVYVDSRREPVTELTVATADRNFSRAVRVETQGRAAPQKTELEWIHTLGSGTLARLDFRSLQRSDLSVAIPETREARYRLVIENRDSPPLAISGVEARGVVYELVFLAHGGEQYRLAYGNPAVAAPSYDTAALAASLGEGFEPLAATLGAQAELAVVAEPAAPALSRLLNDPKFLTGAIALLVVVLAVGLYRATRRLDALPPDEK